MKILILVNGAHEHRPFYGAVGAELESRGHTVHYALDSRYTDVLHPETKLNGNVHYFSSYFRDHRERHQLPEELAGTNPSLMMFPDLDRYTFTFGQPRRSTEWYHSLVANLGHFFVELFREHQFDSVVYENVSNSFSYFAYAVASARGARYIGFAASRIPGRIDVLDRAWARDSRLEKLYRGILAGDTKVPEDIAAATRKYIANFDHIEPDYMAAHPFEAGLLDRYAKRRPIQRMVRSMKYRVTQAEDAEFGFQQGNPFVAFPEQFARESLRRGKLKILERRHYQRDIDTSVPYFAYPLQFHPESSTSVDGPAFIDEWSNIQGILQNLPAGYSLYVKDHRHAAGRQPLAFYERLCRQPNVVLVSPYYNAKNLMRNAKAIVCSTSTFGFEALILGRPVFVLGHPFYDFVPSCKRLSSFDGAHRILAHHAELKSTPEEIYAFVAAYHMTSEPGRLDLMSMYADPKVAQWIAGIVEKKTSERDPHPSAPPHAQVLS